MILFVRHSRKDKTIVRQSKSMVAWDQGWGKYNDCKGEDGKLGIKAMLCFFSVV